MENSPTSETSDAMAACRRGDLKQNPWIFYSARGKANGPDRHLSIATAY